VWPAAAAGSGKRIRYTGMTGVTGETAATSRVPAVRAPATLAICGLTVTASSVFLLLIEHSPPGAAVIERWLGSGPGSAGHAGQIWRVLSASWVHWGPLHLLINLTFLLWLGPPIERRIGGLGFAAFYVAAGSFSYALLGVASNEPGTWGPTVGASGAILAMLTASSVWFPRAAVDLYGFIPTPIPAIAAAFVVTDLTATCQGYAEASINSGVHLSGALFGLAFALVTVVASSSGRGESRR
jgi:membrane associated rhomboid family serine protease